MPVQLCTVKGCPNEGKYCRFHLVETFKTSVPIKKESDSRKEVNKEYRKIAAQFIKSHPKCAVKGCKKASECVHHKAGRVGELLLNKSLFLPVCLEHHRQIEENPEWSKENGYSISRLKEKV
jgi:hypothetical protein